MHTSRSPRRPSHHRIATRAFWLLAVMVGLCSFAALGCEDKMKLGEQQAVGLLERLTPLIDRDTKQVRDGVPEGAKSLGALLDEDPGADPAALQRAIKKARAGVENLAFAKSTFFVFVDKEGVVLRSETDPDLPAGKSLYEAIPGTKKLSEPSTALLEVYGTMHELRGAEKGADMQWVVGHPVKNKEGDVTGSFVTGWSLRRYAHYLEEDTRRHLTKSMADKPKAIPLVYVFVVRGQQAFGAPVTPDVNAQAVGKADVLSKAQRGVYRSTLNVEGRDFVLVAKPFPPMGEGVGLAVLLSPV